MCRQALALAEPLPLILPSLRDGPLLLPREKGFGEAPNPLIHCAVSLLLHCFIGFSGGAWSVHPAGGRPAVSLFHPVSPFHLFRPFHPFRLFHRVSASAPSF
jgi:hypothetical protein